MKQLPIEVLGDVKEAFAGKSFAFVAVTHQQAGGALGVAVANEPGYSPVSAFHANGSYDEMQDEADRLNAELGLSLDESMRVVCSSMAAGKVGA